jgi:hypothetical protein
MIDPGVRFASMMAARSVQFPLPDAVSHTPSPGLASTPSHGTFTTNVAAWATTGIDQQQAARAKRRNRDIFPPARKFPPEALGAAAKAGGLVSDSLDIMESA